MLENNFECYRSPSSSVCELDFLLRGCILKRAIEETKSQLGLMLMENNREKITVEVDIFTFSKQAFNVSLEFCDPS